MTDMWQRPTLHARFRRHKACPLELSVLGTIKC